MTPSLFPNASGRRICAALAILSYVGAFSGNAATVTWSGASGGNFETGANWLGNTAPVNDISSSVALFTGAVTTNAPTITASRSIAGLDFESAGWTIGGSSYVLTVGTNGIVSVGSGTNTINAKLALGASQTWSTGAGNTLTIGGAISGANALTISGGGTVVFGAANTYTGDTYVTSGSLKLGVNQTNLTNVTIGGSGTAAVLDLAGYKMTMSSAKTVTVGNAGTLLLSGTVVATVVTANIVVNSGGSIISTNNASGASTNNLSGNVTLNSGATLSTNNGASANLGRIGVSGDFYAYAGSTISSNVTGYLAFTGTNIFIDSGVTLLSGSFAGQTPYNCLTFSRGFGSQTLTSGSPLDMVFVRDLDSSGATGFGQSATTVMTLTGTGANIGQIYINNIDAGTTTTVRLGSNATVVAGKGIVSQNTASASAAGAAVAFDLNGYTYDATQSSNSGWAPNTAGTVATSPWLLLSSSGTGVFKAGYFTLTGTSTDVTVGANVVLNATLAGGTSDLGLKATGSGTGTIDASSTFAFTASGSHTLRTTGTYASGASRSIGNLLVGSGSSTSTLLLGSAITTGTGSSVTVNNGSTLVLGTYNLTTNGNVNLSGAAITASTGSINLGGDVTASGTVNSTISAPIALGSSVNRNVTVSSTAASLTISGAMSGNGAQLTKLGTGKLIMTGTGTYTGATTVSAGELDINGRLTNSAVTVNTNGTLAGTGILDSSVTASGHISGGLTFNNDVTINSGATAQASAFNGNIVNNGTISSAVNVLSSKTLSGTGSVTSSVNVSGTTSPGNGGTGKLTLDLTYNAGSTANFNVSSTSNGSGLTATQSGLSYSQIVVTGDNLQIGSASQNLTDVSNSNVTLALSLTAADFATLVANATHNYIGGGSNDTLANYFVFDLADGVSSSGKFETLALNIDGVVSSGTIYYSGANDRFNGIADLGNVQVSVSGTNYEFAISYLGDAASNSTIGGNDVVLTVVPEPSTWALLLGSAGMLVFGQRIRRRWVA